VETTRSLVSAGPKLGVNLALGESVSFWPQVTVGVHWSHQEESAVNGGTLSVASSATGSPTTSRSGPWVYAFAPLLFHAAPHFFLGAGPTIYRDFARVQGGPDVGGESTTFGGHVVVGGYWGGDARGVAQTSPAQGNAAPKKARRFGEKGQFVLSSEFDVSGASTTYAGTDASSSWVSINPGFDWFADDHVSVGISAGYDHSESVGFQADGTRVDYSSSGGSIAPRFGVDVPLASALSWYPRVSLAFGGGSTSETTGTSSNSFSHAWTTLGISAPLLVHPAQHAFVGFGPYAQHDLSHTFGSAAAENRGTTIGASALVGGWL
jgi:hypothetical protein